MVKDFFDITKYPDIHQRFLEKEMKLTIRFVKNSKGVLDVGCGIGRMIPSIANIVKDYVGIDTNKTYLKIARERSKKFTNVKVIEQDVHKLSNTFKPESFDKAIALWQTIACVKYDKKAIREIAKVTRNGFLFTLFIKGSLKERTAYYDALGLEYTTDEKTETIFSPQWGASRAYSKEDIEKLVEGTGFIIEKMNLIDNIAYAIFLIK
ncbi:MAG: class I SAM-dependent methyltransferase [Candidatus Aenigmatarchaeota archaeon]|nr:class I SAM-dependent methyltransferase [Nanoarchaeota archaeon]